MTSSAWADWRNMSADELEGLPYMACTWNGTTVQGRLTARRIGPVTVMGDHDLPVDVIITGRPNTAALIYRSIGVFNPTDHDREGR